MELTFLGTGAADWNGTDERGERRNLTSTMVDDALLIDGTMTVWDKVPETIREVLFTHSHADHFSVELLAKMAPVTVHIHASWAKRAQGIEGVTVVPFAFGEPFQAAGYTVTAMPSNHLCEDWNEETAHFLLEKDGKCLLYATDGAWITTRAWQILRRHKLTAAVFDATIGDACEGDYRIFEHNSIDMVRYMLKTLRKNNVLSEDAPVFLTHLARTLHPTQRELERRLAGKFIVAQDGMKARLF